MLCFIESTECFLSDFSISFLFFPRNDLLDQKTLSLLIWKILLIYQESNQFAVSQMKSEHTSLYWLFQAISEKQCWDKFTVENPNFIAYGFYLS